MRFAVATILTVLACVVLQHTEAIPICHWPCHACGSGSASGGAQANVATGSSSGPFGHTQVSSSSSSAGGAVIGTGSSKNSAHTSQSQSPFGSHTNTGANSVQTSGSGGICCC